jgi:hypothetical protein
MQLLQAGVDIATIALWLGHESIETTHVSLETDPAMKAQALEKLEPIEGAWRGFHTDDPPLAFPASLRSCRGTSHAISTTYSFANVRRYDPILRMIVFLWRSA